MSDPVPPRSANLPSPIAQGEVYGGPNTQDGSQYGPHHESRVGPVLITCPPERHIIVEFADIFKDLVSTVVASCGPPCLANLVQACQVSVRLHSVHNPTPEHSYLRVNNNRTRAA